MSTLDDQIAKEMDILIEDYYFYRDEAIPYYEEKLHERSDEALFYKKEATELRKKYNNPENNTRKQLLLEKILKANRESKAGAIKENIEKNRGDIDGHNNRLKPTGRNKNKQTGS